LSELKKKNGGIWKALAARNLLFATSRFLLGRLEQTTRRVYLNRIYLRFLKYLDKEKLPEFMILTKDYAARF
jgi:hypothetical protein